MSAQVLNTFNKHFTYTMFNPTDTEHISAFILLTSGRQHKCLRFYLEDPYLDIVTMMRAKIADYYVANLVTKLLT